MQLIESKRFPVMISVCWLLLGAVSHAQSYPTRPITIVVSTAAGGITDVSTRIYAIPLANALKQKIVVENRPTGGGTVAAIATQNAVPDGYTLLSITGVQHFAIPAMQPVAYEPLKGFTPISLLFRLPSLIVVPYDSSAHSVAELLDLGRKKAGGLSVGSAGVGSNAHLLAAKIGVLTKTPMQFVQYGGGAPLMTDLITGRLDFSFASYTAARSNIEGKKLRPLAISSDTRLPAVPHVPTLNEVGLEQVHVGNWFGIIGPAGMPTAVVARLNEEIVNASRDKTVIERLTENGTIIATTTPQEMATIMRDEAANISELIKELGLQVR